MANLSGKKVRKLRNGQTYYSVWGYPVSDQNAACWPSKDCRRINGVYFYMRRSVRVTNKNNGVDGSVLDRYFSTARGAERFLEEIFEGLHPKALVEATDYAAECDAFDYMWNSLKDIDDNW